MDFKDLVVTGAAFLGSIIGAVYGGFAGFLAGLVVGAGITATWAYQTDLRERRLRQQP